MKNNDSNFKIAQRDYDNMEPPEPDTLELLGEYHQKSDKMETWNFNLTMFKNPATGVYCVDLGECSGSGRTALDALSDLIWQLNGGK